MGLLPRWGVEEVTSEALIVITTYYYTMLQQLLLHCYIHYCYIKLLADSYLMLQDSSEDASLR